MERNVKKLSMMLEAAKELGIKEMNLAHEIGVTKSSVHGWRTKKHIPDDLHLNKTLSVLKKRAQYLATCKVTNESVWYIFDEMGINLSSVVREGPPILTCRSKQDLHEKMGYGIENYPEIRDALEEHFRSIGRSLLNGLLR